MLEVRPILDQWEWKLYSVDKFSTHHKNKITILITVKYGFETGFFIIFWRKHMVNALKVFGPEITLAVKQFGTLALQNDGLHK